MISFFVIKWEFDKMRAVKGQRAYKDYARRVKHVHSCWFVGLFLVTVCLWFVCWFVGLLFIGSFTQYLLRIYSIIIQYLCNMFYNTYSISIKYLFNNYSIIVHYLFNSYSIFIQYLSNHYSINIQ